MFEILKEEFKSNTAKMQQIRAAHEKKVKEIRDVYAPGKIPQFLHEEELSYTAAMKKARLDAINQLNSAVKKLEKQQGGMTATIDTELLATLNAVSNSGMGLTAAELRELGEKVLASGSSICARKLSEIAEESGISLTMPDPEKAKSVLYEAAEKMMSFYRNYNGADKYRADMQTDESRYYFMTDGKFLDDYERQYEVATTSNLEGLKKPLPKLRRLDTKRPLKPLQNSSARWFVPMIFWKRNQAKRPRMQGLILRECARRRKTYSHKWHL